MLAARAASRLLGRPSSLARCVAAMAAPSPSPACADKIICLGKNYVDHQKEMGGPLLTRPIIFLKPPSAAVQAGGNPLAVSVVVPRGRGSCHYETEVAFRVGADGASFDAVTLGLDLTLRDEQNKAKADGHPWEAAKVFRGAAVIGPWVPLPTFPAWAATPFSFTLDGKTVQTGKGEDMMLLPEPALKVADELFGVCPGDWLFTGTPAGVGPILPGQVGRLTWGDKVAYDVKFV